MERFLVGPDGERSPSLRCAPSVAADAPGVEPASRKRGRAAAASSGAPSGDADAGAEPKPARRGRRVRAAAASSGAPSGDAGAEPGVQPGRGRGKGNGPGRSRGNSKKGKGATLGALSPLSLLLSEPAMKLDGGAAALPLDARARLEETKHKLMLSRQARTRLAHAPGAPRTPAGKIPRRPGLGGVALGLLGRNAFPFLTSQGHFYTNI